MANSSTSVSTSNGNSRHQLDNLPDLVNDNLFKYLHLDDIWQLRLINKRFYYIITNDFKIIQLSFIGDFHCAYDNWFSTTKPIGSRNQLDESKLPMIFNPSNNLLNLKYLKITLSNHLPIKVDDLNKFTKLQILMIKVSKGCLEGSINLADLKALSIELDVFRNIKPIPNLIVDTPNLYSLSIGFLGNSNVIDDQIKFKNPLSVKCLKLNRYGKKISIFSDLEYLEFNREFNPVVDDLSMFKSLKKLRINHYSEETDVLKDLFRLKRDDLEMVLDGVKIKKINKLDEYKNRRSDLEYQLANYSELDDDLNFIFSMNYNELVDLLPKNQPSDLFKKYNNIQRMSIKRIEDENRLIHFIRECPNLNDLYIKRSSLGQQFYDQLPVICSLSILIIYEDDIKLNFEFLMKMSYLKWFETNQDVQIDENFNLNNLKYLERFQFRIKNENEIVIAKEDSDRYEIYDGKGRYQVFNLLDQEYFSFDEIIQWLNNERDKNYL